MKTIIAGLRNFHDYKTLIEAVFSAYYHDLKLITEVVSGGAKGVDFLGETFAKANNLPIKRFLPDWSVGLSAGPARNRQMAEYASQLIAIWDGKSKGTKNMIEEATKRGLKVYVHRIDTHPAK